MSRVFTMRKVCPACRTVFTITSAASVFCHNRDCKDKRRRDDRATAKTRKAALPAGSDAHLERALKGGD